MNIIHIFFSGTDGNESAYGREKNLLNEVLILDPSLLRMTSQRFQSRSQAAGKKSKKKIMHP